MRSQKPGARRNSNAPVSYWLLAPGSILPAPGSGFLEVHMAKLTTHVLDIIHGRPASGMKVEFFKVEREGHSLIKTVTLNKDGRTDEPLLEGELILGTYELRFHAGDFLRSSAATPCGQGLSTSCRCGLGSPCRGRIIMYRCWYRSGRIRRIGGAEAMTISDVKSGEEALRPRARCCAARK